MVQGTSCRSPILLNKSNSKWISLRGSSEWYSAPAVVLQYCSTRAIPSRSHYEAARNGTAHQLSFSNIAQQEQFQADLTTRQLGMVQRTSCRSPILLNKSNSKQISLRGSSEWYSAPAVVLQYCSTRAILSGPSGSHYEAARNGTGHQLSFSNIAQQEQFQVDLTTRQLGMVQGTSCRSPILLNKSNSKWISLRGSSEWYSAPAVVLQYCSTRAIPSGSHYEAARNGTAHQLSFSNIAQQEQFQVDLTTRQLGMVQGTSCRSPILLNKSNSKWISLRGSSEWYRAPAVVL
ncbi:hypothetical protein B0H19DRAFT_1084997 [Mycena capillaripes]|nr:hypothetical protein B0H19DRAFT_1084997 [Mycena capillaripes]